MKTRSLHSTKIGLTLLAATLGCNFASAAAYTAVKTGNWSDPLTWGGIAPPFILTTLDQVTISGAYSVTMDSTVVMNGAATALTINGTLISSANSLIINAGTLSGGSSGGINADSVTMKSGSVFSFSGTLVANTLSNSIALLNTSAVMKIHKTLTYNSVFTIMTAGSLTMSAGSVINVLNGSLTVNGGTLNLTASYSVNYISSSVTSGLELSGSGLTNMNVNVLTAKSVTLGSDVTLKDSLNLVNGSLVLNAHRLVINGTVTGIGTITGDTKADITINNAVGIPSSLAFTSGFRVINGLTLNVGSGKSVNLMTDLVVDSTLTLSGGSDINIAGSFITLNGGYNGTGSFVANSLSAITINGSSSIVPAISVLGTAIGNFVMNVGAGNTVTLSDNLVTDTINLQTGILVLGGHNLSIKGDIAALGSGMVFATSVSNISVTTATSTSDSLTFTYPGNTVNNFNVNVGAAGSVMLGSDIIIDGRLNLVNGHIRTGSHNLQIASDSIVGANSNSYVITDKGGFLTLNALVFTVNNFPVGTATTYSPASILLNSGSATGAVGVNVSSGVYLQGTTGILLSATQPLVNSTWFFQTNITSGLNADMQLTWSPATEVNSFIHTGDYISHYTAGAWDDIKDSLNATAVSGGMFSLQRKAVTSFSPFAIFNRNAVTTGVAEVVADNGFTVYPNPVSGNLYIRNNTGNTGALNATIYNVLGQVVSTSTINGVQATIPVNGLAPGNYFIKLYNDKTSKVEKFIKI